jgi:cytochrome c biogenesis factor
MKKNKKNCCPILIISIKWSILSFQLRHWWIIILWWNIRRFLCILFCYISSNFSNYNVFTNSNANAPLFHKISGTWSNHEGSLLLWCWILSFYGFIFGYRARPCNISKRGCSKIYLFFRRSLVAFRFAFFYKERKYKIQMSFAELIWYHESQKLP